MNGSNDINTFLEKLHSGNAAGYSVYFLGIGGIGMSALARYFLSRQVTLSGYDKTATPLTRQLEAEGMKIHYEDDVKQVDKNAVCVVYTPAIPKSHSELNFYKQGGYPVMKRSEVLGIITKSGFNICVAGTHGKTTTSTMIAHVLRHSGYGCNALLGGIASNYDTNFWASERNVNVIEADEYDRSFLQLHPDIAVVTAMDPDHLDIYGTEDTFREAFVSFTARLRTGGTLFSKYGLMGSENFIATNKLTYAVESVAANCSTVGLQSIDGSYVFDVRLPSKTIKAVRLNMGGLHNVENAVVAVAVANEMGLNEMQICEAIAAFKGVKRRFEYVCQTERLVMIDDYAHHPEELRALISSAKQLFPKRKCTIVFQPHLYSRTRDFADGFAEALSLADEVILLPIYPARELPMEGVNSEMIADRMNKQKVFCCSKEEMIQRMDDANRAGGLSVLITAGAGDIDSLVLQVKNKLVGQ